MSKWFFSWFFFELGILDQIQCSFGISNGQAGLLQTVFVVSYMIFAPVFGYLGDRYSRKYIMAAGVFLWSLTTLMGSFMEVMSQITSHKKIRSYQIEKLNFNSINYLYVILYDLKVISLNYTLLFLILFNVFLSFISFGLLTGCIVLCMQFLNSNSKGISQAKSSLKSVWWVWDLKSF